MEEKKFLEKGGEDMENKKIDLIKLKCVKDDLEIVVNEEVIITLNSKSNSLDTAMIFNKLNIEKDYTFELNMQNEAIPKELEELYKYTKMFLENLKGNIDKIDYSNKESDESVDVSTEVE